MPRPANPSAISTWISKPRALVIFSLHAIHKLDLTSCLNLSKRKQVLGIQRLP